MTQFLLFFFFSKWDDLVFFFIEHCSQLQRFTNKKKELIIVIIISDKKNERKLSALNVQNEKSTPWGDNVLYVVVVAAAIFYSLSNSCLDVNWTVCLDFGRWMLWLFYVNVSVVAKWKDWTKIFFSLASLFDNIVLSHQILNRSAVERKFPTLCSTCVRLCVWVHTAYFWQYLEGELYTLFVLPSKIAFYELFVFNHRLVI